MPELDDGMTEAERNFFATGGEVSDALTAENNGSAPAAPPEPQAEPAASPTDSAAQAQPQGEDDDEPAAVPGRKPTRISFLKFEAEQQARQSAETRLRELELSHARGQERLSLLQEALREPAAQPQPEEKPDPEKDIFAYARWLERQLDTRVAPIAEKVSAYEQQLATGQAEMEAQSRYVNTLNDYAGQEPHFLQAYNYLIRNRAAELMAPRYPQATFEQLMAAQIPQDIMQSVMEEERSLYHSAFESNQNPAENIFRMARARGFRPQAPAAQNGAAQPANGAAQPAQPTQQQRPGTPLGAAPPSNGAARPQNGAAPQTAADLVQSIQRGQPVAQSLSNVSGGTGVQLTPELLANMSDAEFAALFNELQDGGNKQKLMELMGH